LQNTAHLIQKRHPNRDNNNSFSLQKNLNATMILLAPLFSFSLLTIKFITWEHVNVEGIQQKTLTAIGYAAMGQMDYLRKVYYENSSVLLPRY